MIHRHGGDIYTYQGVQDFSANINFRGMPESVRRAAMEAVDASVHYPDPEYRALRLALAKRESVIAEKACRTGADAESDVKASAVSGQKAGTAILPEHIICGNGAAELMFSLVAARMPRSALLAVPSFFEYEQALASCGCQMRWDEMKRERGFRLEESFLKAIREDTDMIILGNPNNPTGRCLEAGLLRRLLAVCREKQILLVLDESFFDFLEEDMDSFSGVTAVQAYPNLFVLKSFTKMYAMPGLRLGYGICSDTKLLYEMRKRMQPWNVSVPAAAAAEAAATELTFARETAREVAANRTDMKRGMERAGYRVYPSDTNFLLFEGPEDLQKYCIKRGFLIRDCGNFRGLGSLQEKEHQSAFEICRSGNALSDEQEQPRRAFFRICIRSREENTALLRVLEERNAGISVGEEAETTL